MPHVHRRSCWVDAEICPHPFLLKKLIKIIALSALRVSSIWQRDLMFQPSTSGLLLPNDLIHKTTLLQTLQDSLFRGSDIHSSDWNALDLWKRRLISIVDRPAGVQSSTEST